MESNSNNLTVQLIRALEQYKFDANGERELILNYRVPFGNLYEAMGFFERRGIKVSYRQIETVKEYNESDILMQREYITYIKFKGK